MSNNLPIITQKPWGKEHLWALVDNKYAAKIITVNKGQRLSLQYHDFKCETMMCLEGIAVLQIESSTIELHPGEAYTIHPKTIHRLSAPYGDVKVVEVSTTELDDVIRLSDDYQRL